jgi:hypothetical protein
LPRAILFRASSPFNLSLASAPKLNGSTRETLCRVPRLHVRAIEALTLVGGMVSTNFDPSVSRLLRLAIADSNLQMRHAAEYTLANWADVRNEPDFLHLH